MFRESYRYLDLLLDTFLFLELLTIGKTNLHLDDLFYCNILELRIFDFLSSQITLWHNASITKKAVAF